MGEVVTKTSLVLPKLGSLETVSLQRADEGAGEEAVRALAEALG